MSSENTFQNKREIHDYMMNNDILLKVDKLEQYFKMGKGTLKAVDGVSFEVKKGEVFGIVGESGCGKTTTGRSIIRLYDITGGSIYFEGQRICAGIRSYKEELTIENKRYAEEKAKIKAQQKEQKNSPDYDEESFNVRLNELKDEHKKIAGAIHAKIHSARYDHTHCNKEYAAEQCLKIDEKYAPLLEAATTEEEREEINKKYKEERRLASKDRIMNKIQMIFQDPIASLNPRMTVREIIAEGLIIRGVKDKKYIDEQVYKVLDLVGLVPEHAVRYPHEFSGGQRQRIGIARSIILNPDLIIADEPVSALDVSIQAQVINLLNDLRDKLGLTIIFIAHDLSVVKYFSDRIAVMYFGKIVELTTSDELFAHPLHPYTKSLLSAIPLPDPRFEKQRKRIIYNPIAEHDYSVDKPQMHEIVPGHFIYCNEPELERYRAELAAEEDKAKKLANGKTASKSAKAKTTKTAKTEKTTKAVKTTKSEKATKPTKADKANKSEKSVKEDKKD